MKKEKNEEKKWLFVGCKSDAFSSFFILHIFIYPSLLYNSFFFLSLSSSPSIIYLLLSLSLFLLSLPSPSSGSGADGRMAGWNPKRRGTFSLLSLRFHRLFINLIELIVIIIGVAFPSWVFFSFLIFLSWGSVFVINSRLGTRLSVNRASLEIVRIVALAADVGCGGGALMQIPFLRIREGKSFARRTARKVPVGGRADGEEAGREAVSNLIFRRPTDVLIFLFLLFQMNQLMVWFRYIHRY